MLYAFQEKNGDAVEWRQYAMREAPKLGTEIEIGGKTFVRILDPEMARFRNTPGNWPMWSHALGVHPDQIAEARALDQRLGVQAEYRARDGAVKFYDKAHRRAFRKAHGYVDNDGGYMD